MSAALAAVVDTATAKHQEDRYADDAELIADLEDVLAIETARAGSATGEVTTVLRTLPTRTQRRVPFRLRHPAGAILLAVLVIAALAGGAVWLAPRTHHGTAKLPQPVPTAAPKLSQVVPCTTCAHDYNPLAPTGPKTQHPNEVGLAIDGLRNTAWTTEQYYNGLQKAGVGIYVDASPGLVARELVIDTATPGYNVVIYARNSQPNPDVWDPGPGGWVKLGGANAIHATQPISLTAAGVSYRYYLVWITSLGPHNQVAVNEIALYK